MMVSISITLKVKEKLSDVEKFCQDNSVKIIWKKDLGNSYWIEVTGYYKNAHIVMGYVDEINSKHKKTESFINKALGKIKSLVSK